jgi:hypothetical protein
VAALTEIERELLAAIAIGEEHSRRVLADYWIEQGDGARGSLVHLQYAGSSSADAIVAEHGDGWRREAVAAGFAAEQLAFHLGFAPALVVDPDEPFARSAAGFRLSPRHYRVVRVLHRSDYMTIAEVCGVSATGTFGRFVLKYPLYWDDNTRGLLERERILLRRIRGRRGLCQLVETAVMRTDRETVPALVLEWAGDSLGALLGHGRSRRQAFGEAFAISVGLQLCDALTELRDTQIRHRALGPGHVLVGGDGKLTLVDYQSARCDAEPDLPLDRTQFVRT